MNDRFHIKPGYKLNSFSSIGNDTVDDSERYQCDVYRIARTLLRKNALASVLDLGCGMAMKLRNFILPSCTDITGVDEPRTIERCAVRHRFGTWVPLNMESGTVELKRKFDLIIASDVIEHMLDPDMLLNTIKLHCRPDTWIVISTPNRDAMYSPDHMGPPANPGHIREWSSSEFQGYIQSRGFEIVSHTTVNPISTPTSWLRSCVSQLKTLLIHRTLGTQVVVVKTAK